MIFYASQRGNAAELAAHLLNAEDNEHVAVHDIRGFVSEDLAEALEEAAAVSKGTRCKKYLFSLSLNPPEDVDVPLDTFEKAISDVEKKLGLEDQPRIIVFHEKNGRRHCHAVWSRIDDQRMVAIKMSHFKLKLQDVSRQLFLEHGWELPEGMKKGKDKNPFNLTREEYRQAKRLTEDPNALKVMFKQVWERTDSKKTFGRMLADNGFYLAQGDKRGFVAVDIKGKVYSLSRWVDIGTRELKARLGKPEDLPTVEQARAFIVSRMTENLRRYLEESKEHAKQRREPLRQEIRAMTLHHREDRQALIEMQEKRRHKEALTRSKRFNRGISGLWDRVTGEHKRKCAQNEQEIKACLERDRRQLHELITKQLKERRELEKTVRFYRQEDRQDMQRLRQEIARYISTATVPPADRLDTSGKMGATTARIALVESEIEVKSQEILRKVARYAEAKGSGGAVAPPAPAARTGFNESSSRVLSREVAQPEPLLAKDKARDSVLTAARGAGAAAGPPPSLAEQVAAAESGLVILSGDLAALQASLENNQISDSVRAKILHLIEKAAARLQLKVIEAQAQQQRAEAERREIAEKQAEFIASVKRYAELQQRYEEEQRRIAANRDFYAIINNMGNSLNGIPLYKIVMTVPDHLKLDERAYVRELRQQSSAELLDTAFRRPPPLAPESAVPDLRQSVLQVGEILRRAGAAPPTGQDAFAPAGTGKKASVKFSFNN